jgi:2-phospho-L-lactate guanylyltransferase
VIPIRAFAMGKARLADTLDVEARARLGRHCADRVVSAAGDLPTVVVTSDPEVRAWAVDHAVAVLHDPGSLDGAAGAGRRHLAELGCVRVVIAHADLPYARSFSGVIRDGSCPIVTIVPCHRDDGTPVLSLPTAPEFRFSYGPGSFRRHAAEARRLSWGVRVVRDRALGFDIDVPDDLVALDATLELPRR